jgi:methionyl-tRNA formyltransferase
MQNSTAASSCATIHLDMRIVFFGTSAFAVPTLQALFDSSKHAVLAVATQPDRPSGRGLQLHQSPVKIAAIEAQHHVPILQPEKARTREFREQIAALAPDALVVAAFGQILSQRLLDLPKYGGINVHGSLLPRWRGAAPMQYALMAGDKETGVTTMQMDAGMDTGDMLLKATMPIESDDNVETIERKLSTIGAPLLLETLDCLERGDCPHIAQNPDEATYAPSLQPDIGFLDWTESARRLANLIRGVTPRPGAWMFHGGKRIKVWTANDEPDPALGTPGEVVAVRDGVSVACAGGSVLTISLLQPEGKQRMAASDWARGARMQAGDRFDPVPKAATL